MQHEEGHFFFFQFSKVSLYKTFQVSLCLLTSLHYKIFLTDNLEVPITTHKIYSAQHTHSYNPCDSPLLSCSSNKCSKSSSCNTETGNVSAKFNDTKTKSWKKQNKPPKTQEAKNVLNYH